MTIKLIKKIREDGEPCAKSARVLNELEALGLMGQIDQVVIADERQPDSEGYALAVAYNVSAAPFFIVDADDDGSTQVYTAYHRFMSEVFNLQTSEAEQISEIMAENPDLDFI